jgi:hypothetical protein
VGINVIEVVGRYLMVSVVDISPAVHFRWWRYAATLFVTFILVSLPTHRSINELREAFDAFLSVQLQSYADRTTPIMVLGVALLFTRLRYRAIVLALVLPLWAMLTLGASISSLRAVSDLSDSEKGEVFLLFLGNASILAMASYGALRMWAIVSTTDNTLYLVREGDLAPRYFADLAAYKKERAFKVPLLRFSWRAVRFFGAATVIIPIGMFLIMLPISGLVAFALGCLVLSVGARQLIYGRRALLVAARELRKSDWRPPVLFIRSFKDDGLRVASSSLFNPIRAFARTGVTFEELVSRALSRVGPVVAITGQSDELAPFGAARDLADEAKWRDRISALFDEARIIAVVVGETPGLFWEVRESLARGHAAKLVFLFPPLDVDKLQQRWDALRPCLAAAGMDQQKTVSFSYPSESGTIRSIAHFLDGSGACVCVVADRNGAASFACGLELAIGVVAEASYKIIAARS